MDKKSIEDMLEDIFLNLTTEIISDTKNLYYEFIRSGIWRNFREFEVSKINLANVLLKKEIFEILLEWANEDIIKNIDVDKYWITNLIAIIEYYERVEETLLHLEEELYNSTLVIL